MGIRLVKNAAAAEQLRDGNVTVLDPLAQQARDHFKEMAAAIEALSGRVHHSFGMAVRLVLATRGHLVVTGIGKSGHIGQKLSATLTSTGTPSFFIHSGEALHGDLGSITERDAVLLISNSGETQEVVALLPHLKDRGIPTVGLVGNPDSTLAHGVDVCLDVSVDREICPNNLAPTSSTLAAMAMADALTACLTRMRNFEIEDFARLHPGGRLGRRLCGKARDIAVPLPTIARAATVRDCILRLTRAEVHVLLVVDRGRPCGVVTDRELQRLLHTSDLALDVPVAEIMSTELPAIGADTRIGEVEARMAREGIDYIIAVDDEGKVCGAVLASPRR